MPTTNEPIPSVPQFRPFLREKLCGTDGMGLKSPHSAVRIRGTRNGRERTGTDGNGRTGRECRAREELFGLEQAPPAHWSAFAVLVAWPFWCVAAATCCAGLKTIKGNQTMSKAYRVRVDYMPGPAALEALEADPESRRHLRVEGDSIISYGPLRATASCAKCHGVEPGTLLGMFRYRFDLQPDTRTALAAIAD